MSLSVGSVGPSGRHGALMEAALSSSIFHTNLVTTYTCDLKPVQVGQAGPYATGTAACVPHGRVPHGRVPQGPCGLWIGGFPRRRRHSNSLAAAAVPWLHTHLCADLATPV